MNNIRKAVFPVAGMGTRFLPATKAMPKELLPNNSNFFSCEICNYKTSRKSQFDRHLLTA